MKTAVIVGATGFTGLILVKRLVEESSFGQVIAICRNKKSAGNSIFSSPKVRTLEFDFENWNELELQVRSYTGTSQSCFFCCLGTTIKQAGSEEAFKKVDHDYVVRFAHLAATCRAEQLLVISALGADKNSGVFYNKTKGEMEEHVQHEFSEKICFLRPSLLLGDRQDFRFSERIAILLAPIYTSLLFGTLKKFRPVPATKVAKAMVLLAEKKLSAGLFLENEEILKIE